MESIKYSVLRRLIFESVQRIEIFLKNICLSNISLENGKIYSISVKSFDCSFFFFFFPSLLQSNNFFD